MSIKVELHELEAAIARYGGEAYVITTGPAGRPHLAHQRVEYAGRQLRFTAGRSTLVNATERTHVVVLWPPVEPGQMSLIVDGVAAAGSAEGQFALEPTGAVLHRRPQ